jgi:rubredoxin
MDHTVLTRKQTTNGMYWECPDCDGRSIGVAVLKKSVEPRTIQTLWRVAYEGGGVRSQGCLHCMQPMRRVSEDINGQTLQLDVCKICQYLWFEPAQLGAPADNWVPKDDENALPPEARFALAQAQMQMDAMRVHNEFNNNEIKGYVAGEGIGLLFEALLGF